VPPSQRANLSKGDVLAVMHLSLKDAAKALNFGTTQLKIRCRALGIQRWPHRKLLSLATMEVHMKERIEHAQLESGAVSESLTRWSSTLDEVMVCAHAACVLLTRRR
jgi:hypothetical protein